MNVVAVAAVAIVAACLASPAAMAQVAPHPAAGAEKTTGAHSTDVLVTVDGRAIAESDLAMAEAEIGNDLGSMPAAMKRRVLIEYLIETQLLAAAAEQAGLGQLQSFDPRQRYQRRKALRDNYFDTRIRPLVSEDDARRQFDAQSAGEADGAQRGVLELKTAHIVVASEALARDLYEQLKHGADFAELARKYSIDPGSAANGGGLSPFIHGQMVAQFEAAAFGLEKGGVSQPVKTQFGWHLIKLEDRRERPPPDFEAQKSRITAALVQRMAQSTVDAMRAKATIVVSDPVVKAQIDGERSRSGRADDAARSR